MTDRTHRTDPWDAGSYDRLSYPQLRWRARLLARVELAGGEGPVR